MRTFIAAFALASGLFAQTPAAKNPVPRPSGEFVIHMQEGDKLLTSYRGKVVVMAFMYTTCPHCQHTAGVLAKIQTEYAAKGVQILGTVFDAAAKRDVGTFIKVTGANFPVGYSTPDQVAKFMHANGDYYVPMLAFIDRAGTVRYQAISYGVGDEPADKFLEDQENTIRKEIDTLLKSAPAATAHKAAAKTTAKP